MTKILSRSVAAVILGLLVLLVAGCGKDKASAPGIANSAPDVAVITQVKLLKAGDLDTLAKASLPPADYQALRKQIDERNLADREKITDEDREKFAEGMAQFTAPDAEQQLYQQIEPKLDDFDKTYRAQLPIYIGMGQTMATTAIDKSETMTPDQKQQAKDMLAAMAQWVQQTNWGDKEKAKQAIAVVTATARQLDLKTLDQAQSLKYEQAMQKYGEVWTGMRKVLAIYALDVNAVLDSVKAKTTSNENHVATVNTTYTLFGKPMNSKAIMIERDGHWYNKDLVEKFETSLAEEQAAKAASSAAAADSSAY